MAERDGPVRHHPRVVRPAVLEHVRHRGDELVRRFEAVLEVDAAGDSAHYERPETMPRCVTISLYFRRSDAVLTVGLAPRRPSARRGLGSALIAWDASTLSRSHDRC